MRTAPNPIARLPVVAAFAALLGGACGPGEPDGAESVPDGAPVSSAPDAETGEDAGRRAGEPGDVISRADSPDGGRSASGDGAIPADTTGTALPGASEIVPEQMPDAAYEACKRAAAVKLAVPADAIWGKAPDSVERTPEGDYALVAQVRTDSLQPGISYACLVRSEASAWRVVTLEAQPPAVP